MPLVNSERMHRALKSLRRETRLVLYPRPSCSLDKPSHLRAVNAFAGAWRCE